MNEFDDEMIREKENDDNKEWNKTLEKKFEKSIKWINILEMNEHEDFRLMSAFITRIKWDLAMKDMNKKIFIQLTITSIIKNKLYKIIFHEKYYIQQYYK